MSDDLDGVREEFRAATALERKILDFVLSLDAVGIVELRK